MPIHLAALPFLCLRQGACWWNNGNDLEFQPGRNKPIRPVLVTTQYRIDTFFQIHLSQNTKYQMCWNLFLIQGKSSKSWWFSKKIRHLSKIIALVSFKSWRLKAIAIGLNKLGAKMLWVVHMAPSKTHRRWLLQWCGEGRYHKGFHDSNAQIHDSNCLVLLGWLVDLPPPSKKSWLNLILVPPIPTYPHFSHIFGSPPQAPPC